MPSVRLRRAVTLRVFRFTISIILTTLLQPTVTAIALEPMLPHRYSEQGDVSGWLISEKRDGVRGYWDGRHLQIFWHLPVGHPEIPPVSTGAA